MARLKSARSARIAEPKLPPCEVDSGVNNKSYNAAVRGVKAVESGEAEKCAERADCRAEIAAP